MPKLVLMRHGQSTWNLENRFTGFTDVPLTELGVTEAKTAGQKLKTAGLKFDVAYTSTLSRAIHTLDLTLNEMHHAAIPVTKSDDLRERDYGGLTGLNKAETVEKYGADQVQIWRRSYDVPPPVGTPFHGESLKDVVEKRVAPYFSANILPELMAGKNILVAAHGNTVRGILVALGINTPDNIVSVEIPTAVPLVIDLDDAAQVKGSQFL